LLDVLAFTSDLAHKKNLLPGNRCLQPKWWRAFKKRHPEFRVGKENPQHVSRFNAETPEAVLVFYNELDQLFDNQEFSPADIFNLDETDLPIMSGRSHVNTRSKKLFRFAHLTL
jgi:hypothetical protein